MDLGDRLRNNLAEHQRTSGQGQETLGLHRAQAPELEDLGVPALDPLARHPDLGIFQPQMVALQAICSTMISPIRDAQVVGWV